MTELIDKEKEEKKFTAEFLMLPCTAMGQTTSSSIAEKSNIWAEHRLMVKKSELDKKLYKSMIKMNVDMRGLSDELTRMKKSASTSSLEAFTVRSKQGTNGYTSGPNSPKVNTKTIKGSNAESNYVLNKNGNRSQKTLNSNRGQSQKSAEEQYGRKKMIDLSLGTESSAGESDESDSNQIDKRNNKGHSKSASHDSSCECGNDLHRAISVTSCTTGRECGKDRANVNSFQNATRRYNKQLFDHSKSAHTKKQ